MKHYIKSALVLFLVLLLLTSCAQNGTDTGKSEVLQISSTTLKMNVGHTQTLTVKSNLSAAPAIKWTSAAPDVATVDENGVVSAISLGTAVIVAESESGAVKYCVVNVVEREYAFEEFVEFSVANLPLTVKYYNKQTGELICEYIISSYSIRTPKNGGNYGVYITLEGTKTYDKDGPDATNPVIIMTSLYRENNTNCNVNNSKKNTNLKEGESFRFTLDYFEVRPNYERKLPLELRIESVIEQ